MMNPSTLSFFIHTFGCQMNQADSEIITSILEESGMTVAEDEDSAGVILLNSCAVRENAVDRIGHFLQQLKGRKRRKRSLILGVLILLATAFARAASS